MKEFWNRRQFMRNSIMGLGYSALVSSLIANGNRNNSFVRANRYRQRAKRVLFLFMKEDLHRLILLTTSQSLIMTMGNRCLLPNQKCNSLRQGIYWHLHGSFQGMENLVIM